MAVEWTKEQRQVIELRNRNILVSGSSRFRKDRRLSREDYKKGLPMNSVRWMWTGS